MKLCNVYAWSTLTLSSAKRRTHKKWRSLWPQVNEMLYAWNVAPCNSQMLNVGDGIHRVTV